MELIQFHSISNFRFVMLNYFALIVLIVLIVVVIAAWVLVGMAPGKIARSRNHPQADAVNVCGWMGVLTMGILCPLAFVWAYYHYPETKVVEEGGE